MNFDYPTTEQMRSMPRSIQAGHDCASCGWPISHLASAEYAGRDENGRAYKHSRCPSIAERRELRRQALEQG